MRFIEHFRIACQQRFIEILHSMAQRRGSSADLPAHLITGIEGESAAYFYLRRKGYTVVARRWTSHEIPGDLDLIAWQESQLCFIEVKARSAHDETPAEHAVDAEKRSTLRRLARQYMRQLPRESPPPVRFDILSVYLILGQKPEFQHFQSAFGWSEPHPSGRWGEMNG
jgi:putative endonuclease